MKMKKIILPILALAVIITGCSTLKVFTNLADGADMSTYKSFNFTPADKTEVASTYFSEINQNRVKEAIAKELATMGYTIAEKPDLMISIFLKVQDKQEIMTSYPYAGRGDFIGIYGGYRYEPNAITAVSYTEGTLIIDLVDTSKNQLVWQGVAVDTISRNNKNAEQKINDAIEKVFLKFPKSPAVK